MDDDYVRYGDVVVLRCKEMGGVLVSFGFLETRVFLQEGGVEAPNSRGMRFRILPKQNYEVRSELERAMLQQPAKLPSLRAKLLLEEDLNHRIVQQSAGKVICYGQEVQLQHEVSGMLLAGTPQSAEFDRACYGLELFNDGREGVHFRMQAHMQLRKDGDAVSYHDPVLFLCTALSLHLHITPTPLSRESLSVLSTHLSASVATSAVDFADRYEANLSVERSVLQLEPFGTGTAGNYLCGGDVIRLQHTELQGEVCCEGLDYTKNGLADVFVRKDKSEHPFEQTSAYGLFVLEHCAGREGRSCTWREGVQRAEFRLRHLTTRRVVCIAGDDLSLAKYSHELASGEEPLADICQLIPTALEETAYIHDGAVVQLSTSEVFWRVPGEEWISTPTPGPESRGMDNASFCSFEIDELAIMHAKVQLAAKRDKKDAFRLVRAADDETQEIEFVMSALAPLQRALMAFKAEGSAERTALESVKRVLEHLILFCIDTENKDAYTCEGIARPRRQKFLRELGVLDLVCYLLRLPFLSSHYDLPTLQPGDLITNICSLSYRLVRLAAQDNRANEQYCAQWMGLFLWHAQATWQNDALHPETTLTEILSDNWQLLAHHLSKDLVTQFLQLMVRSHDPPYVALVSTLCICQGRPVPRNQNTICDLLRADPELSAALLIPLRRSEETIEAQVFDLWVRLEDLPKVSAERDKGETYAYFVALLDLLVNLAQGRNHQTDLFKPNFSLETCIACAFSRSLSDSLRCQFLRLVLSLHIDQGDTRPLQLPRLSRTREPAPIARLSQSVYQAKAFVHDCLQRFSPQQKAEEQDRNSLVLEILRLARFLVSCGVYSPSELKALVPVLVSFLNGATDVKDQTHRDTSRYQHSDPVVLKCKETICELLLIICNIELDLSLTLVLVERRELDVSLESHRPLYGKRSRRPSSAITLLERPSELSSSSLEHAISEQLVCTDSRLCAVLLDLTQYTDRAVAASSFRLLQRLHSRRTELMRQLQQVQLLDSPETLAAYESVVPQVSQLSSAAEQAELWLGRTSDSSCHNQVVHILENFLELCTAQKRLAGEVNLLSDSEARLSRILISQKPDPAIQRLLRNLRVHEPVLELVAHKGIVMDFNPERHREVLRCCYLLLARFCQDNAENQSLLFPQAERILEDISSDLCAGILVQELFNGNANLCSQVKPRFLRGFVAQVQTMPLSASKAWLVGVLAVIAGGTPSVQLEVATQLCSKLDFSKAWLEKCAGLSVHTEAPLEICYLLSVLEVLTAAAEGHNSQVQNICRQILPLDLALHLLSSQHFWPLRRALLRFIERTHLDHEFSHDRLPEEAVKRLVELAAEDMEGIHKQQGSGSDGMWEVAGARVSQADAALAYVHEALVPALTTLLRRRGASTVLLGKSALSQTITNYSRLFHSQCTNEVYLQATSRLILTLQSLSTLRPMLSTVQIKPSRRLAQQFADVILKAEDLSLQGVQERLETEFLDFVVCIRDVERVTGEGLSDTWKIGQKELFGGLIGMARQEMTAGNMETAVTVVKALRKHIELMNSELTTPSADWSSSAWTKCKAHVVVSQHLLRDLGALSFAVDLYVATASESARSECVLFLIAALLGGNSQSQDALVACLLQDPNNQFLRQLKAQLSAYFSALQVRLSKLLPSESVLWEDSEEITTLLDPGTEVRRLLRLLQLLCEGHNLKMQEYLREQRKDGAVCAFTVNMVATIGTLLCRFSRMPHKITMEVGQQLLDTLTEMVQGPCPGAQTDLSQPNILDSCKDLLSSLRTSQDRALRQLTDHKSAISDLKGKAATFLLALLEGENREVTDRVSGFLDFPKILHRMAEVFNDFLIDQNLRPETASLESVEALLKSDSFDGYINEGFSLYILLEKLAEYNPAARSQLPSRNSSRMEYNAYTFFANHTGHIEVVQDRALQRVYFPINPACRLIPAARRNELLKKVSRDSPTSKAQGLLAVAAQLIDELELVERSKLPLTCTLELYKFLSSLCFALSLWINLIILFWLDFTEDSDSHMDETAGVAVRALGVTLLAVSLVTLMLWMCAEGMLVVGARWKARVQAHSENSPEPALVDSGYVASLSAHDTMEALLARGPTASEFTVEGSRNLQHASTRCLYSLLSFWYLISAPGFQLLALQCILTGLGLVDPFLFSLLLFSMVFRNQTLMGILLAVQRNARQLIMTLTLAIAAIFIYAFWGFSLAPWRFWQSGFGTAGWGESLCQNLWQCWLTTLDNGLRLSGGIGDLLVKASFDDKYQWYSRFFLDSSYFFVFRLIFLSITTGIIIDSFAQMRERKKQRTLDKRTKCFICSHDRAIIDRVGGGFDRHCKRDHNVWHYLCFFVHLRRKDPTEFTGAEAFCAKQLEDNGIGWLPVLRALCLPDQPAEQLSEQVDRVSIQAQGLLATLSKL